MRNISAQAITDTVARLCIEANTRLPQDVQAALDKARQEEPWPLAKNTLDLLWSNLSAAREKDLPICQDTGMAVVFIKLPIEMDRTVMSSIIWNHLRQGKEDQSVLQVRLLPAAWISMPQI